MLPGRDFAQPRRRDSSSQAMPPGTPYDDDDDRRRRDSRDTSLGEKFADLASAIKDRTGEALEDMTDKLKKTKESWEESDRQRDRRYDDDDDRPVFRGNRNYEGVGVGVGEALGDMATAVKRTTDRMIEEAKKSEMASRLGNQVEQITKDVRGEGKSQGRCCTSAPCLPVATGSPWRLPSTRARRWLGRRRQGEEHVEYARGVLLRHARVDVSTAQGPREVAAVARLHAARGEGAGAG